MMFNLKSGIAKTSSLFIILGAAIEESVCGADKKGETIIMTVAVLSFALKWFH